MREAELRRLATWPVAVAAAALLGVCLSPSVAGAAPATLPDAQSPASAATSSHRPHYRQLLGTVTASAYLEASVPSAGTYAIEYDITTANAAFFDTYLDGTELGYVGGTTGRYLTRPAHLTAGGRLVQVAGPDGVGRARVYIVSAGAPKVRGTAGP